MVRSTLAFTVALLIILGIGDSALAAAPRERVEWKLVQKTDRPFKIPQIFGYPDKILKKVNGAIDEVTKNLNPCDDDSGRADLDGTGFDVKLNVDYAQDKVFSIYATMGYFCGGPYPTNDATFSMTFDLVSGNEVVFEDLFDDYWSNREKILRVIFAVQIENEEMHTELRNDGSCANSGVFTITNFLGTSEYDFTFSPGGLWVQPRWPHVIEACAERVRVPFEKLQGYANPGSILARVIAHGQRSE
ncbi:MAG: hypothetical protein D3908_02805 [Candidatus Electrothrix sp. AUS4]|nr:hypothetical protein [Candidatus Electrothrix sp. AUS4]